MKKIIRLIFIIKEKIVNKIYFCIISPIRGYTFAKCGKNIKIGRCLEISGPENIYLGENVYIGRNVTMYATKANIILGNHVMVGKNTFFVTGNHRIDIIGRYMSSITNEEKLIENDEDIIVESDVWIGANVIILKGVTIGRGSVIAAGSIVTKNVEPYSIIAGNPGKLLKKRFSDTDILKHEQLLGEGLDK